MLLLCNQGAGSRTKLFRPPSGPAWPTRPYFFPADYHHNGPQTYPGGNQVGGQALFHPLSPAGHLVHSPVSIPTVLQLSGGGLGDSTGAQLRASHNIPASPHSPVAAGSLQLPYGPSSLHSSSGSSPYHESDEYERENLMQAILHQANAAAAHGDPNNPTSAAFFHQSLFSANAASSAASTYAGIASPTTTSDDDQWSYNSPHGTGSGGPHTPVAGGGNDAAVGLDPTVSAQIVLQALRSNSQVLGITYEQIRRQNQHAVQMALAASGTPIPPAPGGMNPPVGLSPTGVATTSTSASAGAGSTEPPGPKRRKTNESEHALIKNYQLLEEGKKNELKVIQDRIRALQQQVASGQSFLGPEHFANRKNKKLSDQTYDALFFAIIEGVGNVKDEYLMHSHPAIVNIGELAGAIYVLKVDKKDKKPPQVGFPFRSYKDSHYTSLDRSTPVICKVKEWPVSDDANKVFRLYHFYLGSKKRKRKDSSADSDE